MMYKFLIFLNRLFAVLFPFYVKIKGVKVYYNSLDRFVASLLWKLGLLEGYELNLFLSKLSKGDVVLDIGANMGVYSLLSSERVGSSGKIIAFEPDNENYECFKKSIRENKMDNIVLHPYAVSNKTETIYFEKNAFNSGNHQIRKEKTDQSQHSIEAVCLDEFLVDISRIDVIKIDIQGAEFFAFEGMKRLIERFPKVLIFAEYWVKGLKNMGVDPNNYLKLLESMDFFIYKIDAKHSCLIPMDYQEIKNNPIFDKDYLNFVLTKDKLNL